MTKTGTEKLLHFARLFKVIHRRASRERVSWFSDEDGIFEYYEQHIAPMIHGTPEEAAHVQREEG